MEASDHLVANWLESSEIVDREKVLAILRNRFPGSAPDQLAAAANALLGLKREWREVVSFDSAEGRRFKVLEHVGD